MGLIFATKMFLLEERIAQTLTIAEPLICGYKLLLIWKKIME